MLKELIIFLIFATIATAQRICTWVGNENTRAAGTF